MTETSDIPIEPVRVEIDVPHALHARYSALVAGGTYGSMGEVILEAMRGYVMSVIDAGHYRLTLDIGGPTTPDA